MGDEDAVNRGTSPHIIVLFHFYLFRAFFSFLYESLLLSSSCIPYSPCIEDDVINVTSKLFTQEGFCLPALYINYSAFSVLQHSLCKLDQRPMPQPVDLTETHALI